MRNIYSLFVAFFLLIALSTSHAQITFTESFKLDSDCRTEFCKKQMESYFAGKGVRDVEWDIETRYLTISYEAQKVTADEIKKKLVSYLQSSGIALSKNIN